MKRFFWGLTVLFALTACNKSEMLNDNTNSQKQKAKGTYIYVDNVNREIAEGVATTFFEMLDSINYATVTSLDSVVDWNGKTAVYIFNFEPTGFVFTSADVKNDPIIAYSKESIFNMPKQDGDIPDALTSMLAEAIIVNKWIQEGGNEVPQHIPQNNINSWFELQNAKLQTDFRLNPDVVPYIDPCANTPSELVDESATTYGHYCQTIWGQGEPYNYFVPNHYPAGCVAIAVAQIMKFHEYPTNSFNWSIMPNQCTSRYSNISAGDWETARLIKDIGANVNMSYAAGGSGAYSSDARKALVKTYKYSNSAVLKDYDYNRIVNEIKTQHHPIYVDGYGTTWSWRWWLICWWTVNEYEDGHAYVIDGYQELSKKYYNECRKSYSTTTTKFLHYNYGWNGGYNNWFSTSIKDIAGTYEDIDNFSGNTFPNFKYEKQCIYNIHP